MFSIIHDSDTHYGSRNKVDPRLEKEQNPDRILEHDSDVDLVIITGDLTENGYDGKSFCCYNYGGDQKQLQSFKQNYVEPLEEANIPVKLCPGNHDRGRPPYWYQPVFSYIKDRHVNDSSAETEYSFDYQHFRFICCGIYPKNLKWLAKQLDQEVPTILFFHYNLEGEWSDWWSDQEKEDFGKTIEGYPIAGILVGHNHISNVSDWNGHRVISSAGPGYTRIDLDPEEGEIVGIKFQYLKSKN